MARRNTSVVSLSLFVCLNTSYMNAKEVHITLPKVPHAIKVNAIVIPAVKVIVDKKNETDAIAEKEEQKLGAILFSKRVPPNYEKKEIVLNKDSVVGEVNNNRVAPYLHAALTSQDDVKSKLRSAGFTILASYGISPKDTYTSIVFTNDDMVKSAAKDTRGFASTLRLLIDNKSAMIHISNPLYIMKAFMQESYDSDLAIKTLSRLRALFSDLKNSKDLVKFSNLEKYQFMMSMPYYEDMIEVASGSNASLLQKAQKSNKIVYEQHLSNGSIVLGIKLSKRTGKFVKKLGYENGGLLPYPLLIENNKAKILAPKYYIALMYPMLSMSQFMGIATTPGAIEKECDKLFR